MLAYQYFEAINNGIGMSSLNDITISEGKRNLREALMTSVHYDSNATRNGIRQGLVVTASDSYYKYKVEALPGDDLFVGDVIYSHGEYWIVVKTRVASPFQTIGLMWLCNCLFRWQNGTSKIIYQWGVLDSGVYSTTKDGDETVKTADKQYKIYLPKNNDTQKLYIDKRLATEYLYDSNYQKILSVYAVTGYDAISSNYGHGGHLLVLNARSDDYVAGKDNLELMICDYIPQDADDGPSLDGIITGYPTLRIGTTRRYAADFDVIEWSLSEDAPSTVEIHAEGNEALVTVALSDDAIGVSFDVIAKYSDEEFATMSVEVIG